jgi:helicase
MAGRAGRPKYDKYGEAVLCARNEFERNDLFLNYTEAEPEDIISKLASQSAVRTHLLASIASGLTHTKEEIDLLISGTFFSCQFDKYEIDYHISEALRFLIDGELIQDNDERYSATPLGKRASQLYVNPETAILFRDVLSSVEPSTPLGMLHLICHSPDQPTTYVTRTEFEEYAAFVDDYLDDFLISPPLVESPQEYMNFLGEVKTARILNDWISENSQRDLTDTYGVGMGDVNRFTQSARWLAYAASEVARIVDATDHITQLHQLRARLRHGVKADILELVGLKGIGRVRGRMLHRNGLHTLTDLYNVSPIKLARIPSIGSTIAKSIKKQLGVEIEIEKVASEGGQDDDEIDSMQTLLEDFL